MSAEFAGFGHPCVGVGVEVREGRFIHGNFHVFGFAGGEADFGKAFELFNGTVDCAFGVGDVELDDFLTCHGAGVGDGDGEGDGVVGRSEEHTSELQSQR